MSRVAPAVCVVALLWGMQASALVAPRPNVGVANGGALPSEHAVLILVALPDELDMRRPDGSSIEGTFTEQTLWGPGTYTVWRPKAPLDTPQVSIAWRDGRNEGVVIDVIPGAFVPSTPRLEFTPEASFFGWRHRICCVDLDAGRAPVCGLAGVPLHVEALIRFDDGRSDGAASPYVWRVRGESTFPPRTGLKQVWPFTQEPEVCLEVEVLDLFDNSTQYLEHCEANPVFGEPWNAAPDPALCDYPLDESFADSGNDYCDILSPQCVDDLLETSTLLEQEREQRQTDCASYLENCVDGKYVGPSVIWNEQERSYAMGEYVPWETRVEARQRAAAAAQAASPPTEEGGCSYVSPPGGGGSPLGYCCLLAGVFSVGARALRRRR
jgi:hypothetical protein